LNGGPVVVVGGGIIGVSLAYHLARGGYRDVTVLDRGLLGEGSTAKATGGIRTQFASRINAELAHAAAGYYAEFAERVGEPFDFRRHGYLMLLSTEAQLAQFRSDVAMQRELGADVRLLAPDEITDVLPGVRTGDLVGAAYSPTDGSGSPADAVAGFARQARRLGVTFRQHTEVVGIDRDAAGRAVAVRTAAERIEAELVVNAAGPWAATVGALAGTDTPVEPHSRQAFGIAPLPGLTGDLPLAVDLGTGAYVHPERNGGVIGGNDRDTPASFDATVNWDLTESLAAALAHRFPWAADARITTGWAGLREMTPDDHGLVGPDPTVPGLFVLAGFSGHGFMQAPVIGERAAAWLLGDAAAGAALAPLDPARFRAGRPLTESTVF